MAISLSEQLESDIKAYLHKTFGTYFSSLDERFAADIKEDVISASDFHHGYYVKDDAAVVDEMFQTDELSHYLARLNLTPQWKEGVFDRLAAGEAPGEELGQPQKGCRIWQLRKGVDVTMRFIGYEDLIQRFGEPDADNYTQVFDGNLGTNDLEQIYAICRDSPPPGYQGYRMALSDVVELYDDSGSEFFYCDRVGFRPIQFDQRQEQNECHEMTM